MNARSLTLVVLAVTSSPAFAADVWVVDAAGGPGSHASSIDGAIAMAAPGDVVLVRAGHYDRLTLEGKGVAVVADAGAAVHIRGYVRVSGVPSGSAAVLRGLAIEPAGGAFLELLPNVEVSACTGSVWIEGCSIDGGWPALAVTDCAEVVLVDVEAAGIGGAGGFSFGWLPQPALRTVRSNVVVHGSHLTGGDGTDGVFDIPAVFGQVGSAGAIVTDGVVRSASSTVVGGAGGNGLHAPPAFIFCSPGQTGGPGLVVSAGTSGAPPPAVFVAASTLSGGLGGDPGSECTNGGARGADQVVNAGAVVVEHLAPPSLDAPATAREGEVATLAVAATPAPTKIAVLVLGAGPASLAFGTPLGVQLVASPLELVVLGPLGSDGTIAVDALVPDVAATASGSPLHLQALVCDAGGCTLGGASHVVLLDASL